MRRYKALLRHGLIYLALFSNLAWAGPELELDTFYDYLAPTRATFVKRIHNRGDQAAFVTVEVAEVQYGAQGTPAEQRLEGNNRALIASPGRLIIPAQGSRDVRVIYSGPRAVERYFRLRFVPLSPTADELSDLSPSERRGYRDASNAQALVLKALGGLLLVHPTPPHFSTEVEQRHGWVRVSNAGNTTVRLESFTWCSTEQACEQARTVHVRPGTVFEQRSPSKFVRFTLVEGSTRHHYTP